MKNLKLWLDSEPKIEARAIYPNDTKSEKREKNRKQFVNCSTCILNVTLENENLTITALSGYCFDGATIPFGLGKGNMKLLVPAMFHDVMCENKSLVKNNRKLSSLIFRKLLIMCGNPKWKAYFMFLVVDNYQRFMGWEVNEF